MAHKLTNGEYRHKGVRIIKEEIQCSTGWGYSWIVRLVGSNLNKQRFETLKQACCAIDGELK